MSKPTPEPGLAGLRQLYSNYRQDAARRSRVVRFLLTIEEFGRLTSSLCHYCGTPPSKSIALGHRRLRVETREHGRYFYNGIDRIDTTADYRAGNVVPCCAPCNYAKHDLSVAEFRAWVERVHSFWASKPA